MRPKSRYILLLVNTIVFLALEGVALWMVSNNSIVQRSMIMEAMSNITNSFAGVTGNINGYFNLKKVNRRLEEENISLRKENDRLRAAILDADTVTSRPADYPMFDYIPAVIVSNSTDSFHNILVINKGSRDGVKEDMGVVTDRGIIGYIKSTGEKYSKVSSLLDIDNMASATHTGTNTFGVLRWDGRTARQSVLMDIPVHTELNKGDTIVSSGYSIIYPPGIPIGSVSDWKLRDGVNYDVTIDLFEEFSRLKHVYVAVRKDIGQFEELDSI